MIEACNAFSVSIYPLSSIYQVILIRKSRWFYSKSMRGHWALGNEKSFLFVRHNVSEWIELVYFLIWKLLDEWFRWNCCFRHSISTKNDQTSRTYINIHGNGKWCVRIKVGRTHSKCTLNNDETDQLQESKQ